MLYAWKDALKELKKQYEQKSKEVLKDMDALGMPVTTLESRKTVS